MRWLAFPLLLALVGCPAPYEQSDTSFDVSAENDWSSTAPGDVASDDDNDPAAPEGLGAMVDRVVDGDTVILEIDGGEERVRLIGIDTPESVATNRPKQCYGKEASEALAGLLPPGSDVVVQRDLEARDRYDRLLLYIYRADDGLFVNRWLVENGFADAVVYEPNSAHADEFENLRAQAEAEGRGLWGSCDGPDQPLDPDDG